MVPVRLSHLRLPCLRGRIARSLLLGIFLLGSLSTLAWVYPEHRAILLLAIQQLDSERRAVLDRLWAEARVGHESRLTEAVADFDQGEEPSQIDFGAWPAIAGDHSCSPANMLNNVLESDWILKVADITARFKHRIEEARNPSDRDNAMRDADILLQRADPEYATRAAGNAVHYPVGRPSVDISPEEYFKLCFNAGSDMNGFGAYAWFHYSALLKAGRYARDSISSEERSALALAMLADEAFALHFLQDLFAAGHSAITRGSSSLRKGTHDYYNEYGYETKLWNGEAVVLLGDVYMRPQDAEVAARAVKRSLEQILDASVGKGESAAIVPKEVVHALPDSMNVCTLWTLPARDVDMRFVAPLTEVIVLTPVPALAEGFGELPRFRAELGGFIGIAPSIRANTIFGAFGQGEESVGGVGTMEFAVRLGVGLEGVMNKSSDGLAFLDIGYRGDSPSTTNILDDSELAEYGNIFAAIPARTGLTARLRLPFWLIPGDLLVAAPILLLTAPETLVRMGVDATNGGFIPWQSRLFTPIGSFQFVLGREVGATFFGYIGKAHRFLTIDYEVGQLLLVETRSIQLTFPVLEYRPFRSFSVDQSSSLVIQFFGGIDIPTATTLIAYDLQPTDPNLHSYWFTGIRLSFDWRHYY
jgi:hypothetical protein